MQKVTQKCQKMNYEFKNLKTFELNDGRVGVSFSYNDKRYRFFNSKAINDNYNPNTCAVPDKQKQLDLMKLAFSKSLEKGWRPKKEVKLKIVKPIDINFVEACKQSFEQKMKLDYSSYYIKDLKTAYAKINDFVNAKGNKQLMLSEFDSSLARELINYISESKRVQLNYKRTYSALLSEMFAKFKLSNPFQLVKLVKTEEVLHKPIKEIKLVFEELQKENTNLHLCCLLAFGCLLRPHREIRNLKWDDFNEDCSMISLSGAKNKGKKNRIVPIPLFVRQYLKKGDNELNIFTNTEVPFNADYFKTLWSRYKKESKLIDKDNTLYSFRHTGAINVYEKTGSLSKLQQVMGHSNLNVSLTYLRGLGVKQLDVEDMPDL